MWNDSQAIQINFGLTACHGGFTVLAIDTPKTDAKVEIGYFAATV